MDDSVLKLYVLVLTLIVIKKKKKGNVMIMCGDTSKVFLRGSLFS